jgi:hypothetical protein
MIKLSATTLQEASKDLIKLRAHKPYKYSGKWFLIKISGQVYGYRSKDAVYKKLRSLGIFEFELLKVG